MDTESVVLPITETIEEDELEQMSISGTSIVSERTGLMKKLEMHSKMQQNFQDEMETASLISANMAPPPPV